MHFQHVRQDIQESISRSTTTGLLRRDAFTTKQDLARGNNILSRGIVVQVWAEPSLDFSYGHFLTLAVIGDLIAINFSEGEIA